MRFVYGTITPYGPPFQACSTTQHFGNSVVRLKPYLDIPRHRTDNPFRVSRRCGLACSLFARHYWGSRVCFSFLGVLRCFNSPGSLYQCYVFTLE